MNELNQQQNQQPRRIMFCHSCCQFCFIMLFLVSRSVSNSLRPYRLSPRPWDFPGKNTGVSSHFLLQGIFLTQGLNPCLLHCRWILYHLSQQGSPQKFQAYVKILKIKKLQYRKSKRQENFASFPEKLKCLESPPSLSTIISSTLKVIYFVLVLYTKFKNIIFKLLSD